MYEIILFLFLKMSQENEDEKICIPLKAAQMLVSFSSRKKGTSKATPAFPSESVSAPVWTKTERKEKHAKAERKDRNALKRKEQYSSLNLLLIDVVKRNIFKYAVLNSPTKNELKNIAIFDYTGLNDTQIYIENKGRDYSNCSCNYKGADHLKSPQHVRWLVLGENMAMLGKCNTEIDLDPDVQYYLYKIFLQSSKREGKCSSCEVYKFFCDEKNMGSKVLDKLNDLCGDSEKFSAMSELYDQGSRLSELKDRERNLDAGNHTYIVDKWMDYVSDYQDYMAVTGSNSPLEKSEMQNPIFFSLNYAFYHQVFKFFFNLVFSCEDQKIILLLDDSLRRGITQQGLLPQDAIIEGLEEELSVIYRTMETGRQRKATK